MTITYTTPAADLAPEALAALRADDRLVPGTAPMASEVAEAHLNRIEHLLAELEQAATALAVASAGPDGNEGSARFLDDGSRQPLIAWARRVIDQLELVYERRDCTDPVVRCIAQ